MRGILLRVGVDTTSGGWNAPCSPDGRFCYVPVPDDRSSDRGKIFNRQYTEFSPFVTHLGEEWPANLRGNCHLDPDFGHLTYGDGNRRGRRIKEHLSAGDFIAFFAGLRCMKSQEIICSIIGFYTISFIANVSEIGLLDCHRNAHTRYAGPADRSDVVVFANPSRSGRLTRHIPIGGHRERAHRVYPELLIEWGDLQSSKGKDWLDGFITRTTEPPFFRKPERFLSWFWAQKPKLVHANNV